MAILQKLKSLLGFGGTDPNRTREGDSTVPFERDRPTDENGADVPPAPQSGSRADDIATGGASSGDAEAETVADADAAADADESAAGDETPAGDVAEVDAAEADSTLDESDEAGDVSEPVDADEPDDETDAVDDVADLEEASADETGAADSSDSSTEATEATEAGLEGAEPAEETEPDEDATAEAEPSPSESAEPVDSIKGIGSAYADRLGEAGVETIADLANADAEDLAEACDISATRIEGWIERAQAR